MSTLLSLTGLKLKVMLLYGVRAVFVKKKSGGYLTSLKKYSST
jgi:hypothetical protein